MDQQTYERLKFISRTHRTLFDQRRPYEWKVLITTLTLYALTVAAKHAGRFPLAESCGMRLAVWIVSLLLAAATSRYIYHIHKAHSVNKKFAEAAERAIIEECGVQKVKELQEDPETLARSAGLQNWSLWWQVAVILGFALVAAWLLTATC